jgi:parallel beta-helix repeat protein
MEKYPFVGTSIIVFILLILCSFPSTTGYFLEDHRPLSKHIITVDNEPGDADYTSIMEALNHSSPGDTIEVFSGTYYEHGINITKDGISLIGIPYELGNGNDTGKPFINGGGNDDLIEIKAENVTIDGFHMENKGSGANGIIGIYEEADHCIISNNDLAYTTMSIIWNEGSSTWIINNSISYSTIRQGIVLRDPSHDNFVSGNIISNCDTGILLWDSPYNLITKNIIYNCSEFGIDNTYIYNTFQYNTLKDNQVGYQTLTGVYNSIINNNFIDNQVHAQYQYNQFRSCFSNRWIGNYWDKGRILPYPIVGQILFLPWIQFDWNPAKEPNSMS